MSKFFIGAVRYDKRLENGQEKKVTEAYLVDALSFTECESKLVAEMRQYVSGDFEVVSEKRTNIEELLNQPNEDDADKFYSCKINFITLNEKTGKEKKQAHNYMVRASNIDKVKSTIEHEFNKRMIDYNIVKIEETNILDVFAQ